MILQFFNEIYMFLTKNNKIFVKTYRIIYVSYLINYLMSYLINLNNTL